MEITDNILFGKIICSTWMGNPANACKCAKLTGGQRVWCQCWANGIPAISVDAVCFYWFTGLIMLIWQLQQSGKLLARTEVFRNHASLPKSQHWSLAKLKNPNVLQQKLRLLLLQGTCRRIIIPNAYIPVGRETQIFNPISQLMNNLGCPAFVLVWYYIPSICSKKTKTINYPNKFHLENNNNSDDDDNDDNDEDEDWQQQDDRLRFVISTALNS